MDTNEQWFKCCGLTIPMADSSGLHCQKSYSTVPLGLLPKVCRDVVAHFGYFTVTTQSVLSCSSTLWVLYSNYPKCVGL